MVKFTHANLQLIIDSSEKYGVFSGTDEQVLHTDERLPGSDEVIENNDVPLWRNIVCGENGADAVTVGRKGAIVAERQAEMFADFLGDHRGEVALLVSAFRCGDYRVVFGREERADDRPNEWSDIVGEEVHHIIISLNVGEGAAIDRLFPDLANASPTRNSSVHKPQRECNIPTTSRIWYGGAILFISHRVTRIKIITTDYQIVTSAS